RRVRARRHSRGEALADRRCGRSEGRRTGHCRRDRRRGAEGLEHDLEKWPPVFGKDHAQRIRRRAMPKCYWIPHIDVRDAEGYKAYMAATPSAHAKYKGVALVRGGRMEVVEGRARPRVVLREFPDYAAALACYRSPEYQSARPLRLANSTGDFVIVEGYEGPQPPPSASPPPAGARKGYWIG